MPWSRRGSMRRSSFPVIEGDSTVHIVYRGDVTDLVLAGDMLETGHPMPMHRVKGTDLYYASFQVAPDARMAYQFVRNLGSDRARSTQPRRGHVPELPGGGVAVADAASGAGRAATRGTPARHGSSISRSTARIVMSNHLRWGGKRPVHVYLPPGYDTDTTRRYPTVVRAATDRKC